MTLIITPPEYIKTDGSVIFLAGPIQGADHWQNKAIQILEPRAPAIATPRRADNTWQNEYEIQVEWETHYLERAAKNGVILFWCAKEFTHDCGRSYAQTTRYEYAEWLTKHLYGDCPNLVLGVEEGYTGARYYAKRIKDEPRLKDFRIHQSLEETCWAALKLIGA